MTLKHAAEASAFYAERFEGIDLSISELGEIARLPMLSKADIITNAARIRTTQAFPDFIMYTSGTTGVPMEVPVFQAEVEAYNELVLPHLLDRLGKLGYSVPLGVTVCRVGHGSQVLTAAIPTLPCHINHGLGQLIDLLRRPHLVDGTPTLPKALDLNVLTLRQVSRELLEQGVDPASFGLDVITTSGWYLSASERADLSAVWGAPVIDRYGVTEVNGDAKWCPCCEGYHFDFIVIPEFLDPVTLFPVDSGVATMVVTGLFPFNMAVPKIRYRLGDLVEVSHSRCGTAERCVKFLSRESAVARDLNGRATLFPSQVADVLAPLPDVHRNTPTGFLRFHLSTEPSSVVRLDVELAYNPRLYPARASEVGVTLREALSPRCQNGCGLDLRLQPPGSLSTITKV